MYASVHHDPIPVSQLLRWTGRAAGALLFVAWLAYFVVEITRPSIPPTFALPTSAQGIALAVVFGGYALGWRHERAGAIVVLGATAAYIAIVVAATWSVPSPAILWFAAPGVLYLLARHYDQPQAAEPVAN
jgi:hypothetical protein